MSILDGDFGDCMEGEKYENKTSNGTFIEYRKYN